MNLIKKLSTYLIAFSLIFLAACNYSSRSKIETDDLRAICRNNLEIAGKQYKYMASLLQEDQFPRSFENDQIITSGSDWWCSGFYPGTLWYLYEQTGDSVLLREVLQIQEYLSKEQFNRSTHDLGFMMFCSFGNAYRITGDEKFLEIINNSSRSLISRFNPTIGAIKSWDFGSWQFPVIIDNMMNLEMLLWSAEKMGNPEFRNISITHADKTIAHHFRDDYSSFHVVSYDTITGEPEIKQTAQGYSDESTWARGQAWGLYGYTVMYRFTKDQKYLNQAKNIAEFILNHPNLPEDKIPYWDFNAPDIPDAFRDASAAAIIASALLELQVYLSEMDSKNYLEVAETILRTLSSSEYFSETKENGGFLIKHNVGNMPVSSEIDVPLSYADYYFTEAMVRYLELDEIKN